MTGAGRLSLRTRLFAAIGLIVLLSVGLAFAIGAVLTRRAVDQATLRAVGRQADLLAERERVSLLPFSRLKGLKPLLAHQGETLVAAPLDGSSPYLPGDRGRRLRNGGKLEGTVRVGDTSYFYAARLVGNKALVLLRPKRLSATAARRYLGAMLIGALAGAVLAAIASFVLARAIARPVRRVAEASRSLAAERSPEPVPVEGASELALLAESFNDMAAKLAKARAAERNFLLSVSHELKTPLTAIRGYSEGLSEGAVSAREATETIAREALRLERLVRDLLDLARMNKSEFSIHSEPIDLGVAAREACGRYEAKARSFGVALEAVVADPAPAIGDADRTLQVVSNLVENALRLTPPGGSVRVLAERGRLTVEDTGPGLKPDELPRAFDRFFLWERYGGQREVGTGLGLAIVKELTVGMHGRVDVDSEPGRGTRFVVTLPAPVTADAAAELLRI